MSNCLELFGKSVTLRAALPDYRLRTFRQLVACCCVLQATAPEAPQLGRRQKDKIRRTTPHAA
eukprot:12807714-Alexandrium_andersonii.AAC.1